MNKIRKHFLKNDYVVIDDFFSKSDYNKLKSYFYDVGWQFIASTARRFEDKNANKSINDSSFVHLVFDCLNKNNRNKSDVYDIFFENLSNGFDIKEILRIRAGLITPDGTNKEYTHGSHVDWVHPHYTALFYFTTEKDAGHTYIYHEKFDPYLYVDGDHQKGERVDLKIAEKIEAKENRVLIFKGNVYHSSSKPQSVYRRIAVNVNFEGIPRVS